MCLSDDPSRRDQVYGRAPETSALVAQDKSGWQYISTDSLLENIKVLASDEFEGRAPASKGETLTVEFLEGTVQKARP